MSNTIDSFQGEYRFLSNFYRATVYLDGVSYPTVENAYQAAKSLSDNVRNDLRYMMPGDAKRRAKHITLRPDWDDVKLCVMLDLVRQKFVGNIDLRNRLLRTGDAELVEGNAWGDTFWGVCRGVGENHLGKILMRVREEIRV